MSKKTAKEERLTGESNEFPIKDGNIRNLRSKRNSSSDLDLDEIATVANVNKGVQSVKEGNKQSVNSKLSVKKDQRHVVFGKDINNNATKVRNKINADIQGVGSQPQSVTPKRKLQDDKERKNSNVKIKRGKGN